MMITPLAVVRGLEFDEHGNVQTGEDCRLRTDRH